MEKDLHFVARSFHRHRTFRRELDDVLLPERTPNLSHGNAGIFCEKSTFHINLLMRTRRMNMRSRRVYGQQFLGFSIA